MTQTFRHKAQKFAEQLVTEVFAAREGSVPAEPAGEPPSMPEELKKQSVSPVSTAAPPTTADGLATDVQEPQAYRDESRVSEFGEFLLFSFQLRLCMKISVAVDFQDIINEDYLF